MMRHRKVKKLTKMVKTTKRVVKTTDKASMAGTAPIITNPVKASFG